MCLPFQVSSEIQLCAAASSLNFIKEVLVNAASLGGGGCSSVIKWQKSPLRRKFSMLPPSAPSFSCAGPPGGHQQGSPGTLCMCVTMYLYKNAPPSIRDSRKSHSGLKVNSTSLLPALFLYSSAEWILWINLSIIWREPKACGVAFEWEGLNHAAACCRPAVRRYLGSPSCAILDK